MRFAPIMPHRYLHLISGRSYHMALAGEIMNDPGTLLRSFYRGQWDAVQSFTVLDNGAYEGDALPASVLLSMALDIRASEITMPDVIRDRAATLQVFSEGIDYLKERKMTLSKNNIRLAIVPQGTTIYEWGQSLKELMRVYDANIGLASQPFTISIPKHTATWFGGRANLIERFVEKVQQQYDCHINLFGIDEPLNILTSMAYRYMIRSADSTKPVLHAIGGDRLPNGYVATPRTVRRPANYFEMELDELTLDTVQQNMSIYTLRLSPKTIPHEEVIA